MYNMNSGYHGYSMSNRALMAYKNGEKPLSKWSKAEIIEAIASIDQSKADLFEKVSLPVLKKKVLLYSSWHHTSAKCNKTDFYSIDVEFIEEITEEEIASLCTKTEKQEIQVNKFRGDIIYLEWTGTRRHPKAKEKKLENVNIEERGHFYYVKTDDGVQILKKKISSRGTRVIKKESV